MSLKVTNTGFPSYPLVLTRRSHWKSYKKKNIFQNFAKFTGKHLCQSLLFNKVAVLRSATLLKKRLWPRCFPVNSSKFLRAPFLQNICGRLLLFKNLTLDLKLNSVASFNFNILIIIFEQIGVNLLRKHICSVI